MSHAVSLLSLSLATAPTMNGCPGLMLRRNLPKGNLLLLLPWLGNGQGLMIVYRFRFSCPGRLRNANPAAATFSETRAPSRNFLLFEKSGLSCTNSTKTMSQLDSTQNMGSSLCCKMFQVKGSSLCCKMFSGQNAFEFHCIFVCASRFSNVCAISSTKMGAAARTGNFLAKLFVCAVSKLCMH